MEPITAKSALKTWRIRGLEEVEFVIDTGCPRWPAHMHQDSTLDLIESGTVEYKVRNRRFFVYAGYSHSRNIQFSMPSFFYDPLISLEIRNTCEKRPKAVI